jgi:hypothetical protein
MVMGYLTTRYLAERVRRPKLLDVHQSLPIHIRKLHSYLCEELDIQEDKKKTDCLQKLCAGIVRIKGQPAILRRMWTGHLFESGFESSWLREVEKALSRYNKLYAAMALRDHDLIQRLLSVLTEYDLEASESSFVVAVALEDEQLLRMSLARLAALTDANALRKARYGMGIIAAMNKVMRDKDGKMARKLLSDLQRSPQPTKQEFRAWRKAAIDMSDTNLLKPILYICPRDVIMLETATFAQACKKGDLGVVQLLLEDGKMNAWFGKGTYKTMPLDAAIRTNKTEIVKVRFLPLYRRFP